MHTSPKSEGAPAINRRAPNKKGYNVKDLRRHSLVFNVPKSFKDAKREASDLNKAAKNGVLGPSYSTTVNSFEVVEF